MLEKNDKKKEIREYLLGNINLEEELTRIEEELMTSDEYFQELLLEEEELIQDYVDDHLTLAECQSFEKKFLISEDRREKVRFAYSLRTYISEQEETKNSEVNKKEIKEDGLVAYLKFFFLRRLSVVLAGLIILGVATFIGWSVFFSVPKDNEIVASLNKAFDKKRPFEARITDFDYAPANNLRGNTGKDEMEAVFLDNALVLATTAVSENPSAANLSNLGRVYLAKSEFNKAVGQLEKAQKLEPKNAKILSDLGVSYLEQSKRFTSNEADKKIDYKVKALNTVEAALEVNPNLPEARFNKALCLQELGLKEQARKAWQEYLNFDPSSQWAKDAEGKLEQPEINKLQDKDKEEIVQQFLGAYRNKDDDLAWTTSSRNREMIKGKLIPQQLAFLFLTTDGEEKEEYLAALKYAGELENRKRNDSYFLDIANFYAKTSVEQQTILKQAHQSFQEGFKLMLDNDDKGALEPFKNAQNLYTQAGDEWEAKLSNYWWAAAQYNLAEFTEHKRVLEELAAFCKAKNYKWFLAEIFIWLGVNVEDAAEYSKAIEYHKKAAQLCEDISDIYNLVKTRTILTEEYSKLKQQQLSLDSLQKSLDLLVQFPEISVRQKWRTLNTGAETFHALKYYSAAVAFEEEALDIGEKEQDLTFKSVASRNLGMIYGKQGKYEESIKVLNQSREFTEALKSPGTRSNYLSKNYTLLADSKRLSGDCDNALNDYDKAIEYNVDKYKPFEYNAHKGRLLCYAAQKNVSAVQGELPRVLTLFEQNRKSITEESNRNTFFDNEQEVYDLAISYEYSRNDFEQAFNHSETSRSRSLLDLLQHGAKISDDEPEAIFSTPIEPLKLQEIQTSMPEKTQIVEYAVLEDKVLIWIITKTDFECFASTIAAKDLENKISSYLETLKETSGKEQELSKELYRILISPISDKLDPSKEISVVPDKFLFRLPFPALFSAKTNRFLVEDFTIFYSPSANILLISSAHAEKKALNTAQENILVIGNPAFDRNSFTDLPDLPGAEEEARNIAGIYSKPTSLIGKDATKTEVKLQLPKAEIIHFAGHYVVDDISPMKSYLLLAGASEAAILSNDELVRENLSLKTKLIILSACQTGFERYYKGEGMIGASRTFLRMGIPLVVASQWQVDSAATRVLMSKFHQHRKQEKLTSAEALRRAQLDMLSGQNKDYQQPFYWAAFAPIGGYTAF